MATTNKQALSALTAWIVEAMEYLPLSEETKAGLDILLDLQKTQPSLETIPAWSQESFDSVRARILSDVSLVANGTMSREQCVSYAFNALDIADVTHEEAMQIMADLNAAIDCIKKPVPQKSRLDASPYALSLPARNPAELERYEQVSQLVYHAIESLKNQRLTIKSIHEALEQPASIAEVREIVYEEYGSIEEE